MADEDLVHIWSLRWHIAAGHVAGVSQVEVPKHLHKAHKASTVSNLPKLAFGILVVWSSRVSCWLVARLYLLVRLPRWSRYHHDTALAYTIFSSKHWS